MELYCRHCSCTMCIYQYVGLLCTVRKFSTLFNRHVTINILQGPKYIFEKKIVFFFINSSMYNNIKLKILEQTC